MTQIRWTPNASVSALHAADFAVRFPDQFVDQSVLAAFQKEAAELNRQIESVAGANASSVWSTLIATAAEIESNHELASAVLRKSVGDTSPNAVSFLSGKITEIEAAFKQLFPKFSDQILFRIRPLQEQWLGFGNGLMAHLGRLTEKEILAEDVRVIPVQPVVGGAGVAHLNANLVRIEAVLTNPMAELPEVVRLAWLVSQVHLDLPRFSEMMGAADLSKVAPLAMLPPVLAASQVLEQSRCTSEMSAMAIQHWHIPVPVGADVHDHVAPVLMDWWETYLQTRPAWHIAMQALAKMLGV